MTSNTPLTRRPLSVVTSLLLLGLAPFQAAAEAGKSNSMRVLIEQALDQQVDITIKNQPLSSALGLIGEKTGVKLTIAPDVVELLPYGSQTTVASATLKNVSLRQGLTGMLSNLAMRFRVRDSDVAVEPIEALRRICRKATWTELKHLNKLIKTPWSQQAAGELPIHYQIRTSADPAKELMAQAARIGTGSVAEVLEAATDQLDWTWYPWEHSIIVLTRDDQASRFVDRPMSIKYNHTALADVFADLARQAGLRLRLQPGVLAGLPVQTRQSFSLMMRQATIRTALEMISGITGLAYEVTPKEIIIQHTDASKVLATQKATVIRSQDPIVGKINVPSKGGAFQFEFFIRESDLPDSINKWRKQKISDAVKQMVQELGR